MKFQRSLGSLSGAGPRCWFCPVLRHMAFSTGPSFNLKPNISQCSLPVQYKLCNPGRALRSAMKLQLWLLLLLLFVLLLLLWCPDYACSLCETGPHKKAISLGLHYEAPAARPASPLFVCMCMCSAVPAPKIASECNRVRSQERRPGRLSIPLPSVSRSLPVPLTDFLSLFLTLAPTFRLPAPALWIKELSLALLVEGRDAFLPKHLRAFEGMSSSPLPLSSCPTTWLRCWDASPPTHREYKHTFREVKHFQRLI